MRIRSYDWLQERALKRCKQERKDELASTGTSEATTLTLPGAASESGSKPSRDALSAGHAQGDSMFEDGSQIAATLDSQGDQEQAEATIAAAAPEPEAQAKAANAEANRAAKIAYVHKARAALNALQQQLLEAEAEDACSNQEEVLARVDELLNRPNVGPGTSTSLTPEPSNMQGTTATSPQRPDERAPVPSRHTSAESQCLQSRRAQRPDERAPVPSHNASAGSQCLQSQRAQRANERAPVPNHHASAGSQCLQCQAQRANERAPVPNAESQ